MKCSSCQAENPPAAQFCADCGAALSAPTALSGAPTAETPISGPVVVSVDLSPGALFHSRYEIQETLGRGGMGMVYMARDLTLDEVVAIKVLRPDFAQDPKMAARFKTEIKLARKVRHKNVCTIHDFGEDQGLLFISMERIEGTDLKKVLTESGGLPIKKAYDVAIQIAEGLQAVHEAGIIHRDLKTPNIMLDPSGVARLMDFGIAKREGADGSTMTATGHIVGTPDYMSPEQAQGKKLDFRSDVYALGILTWEIFTGHVPFRGETPISTILKHINEPPPLDGPEAEALPPPLRPVLRKALAKEPEQRHASAAEFAEALRNARSPSRRQQPIATEALMAPTIAVSGPEPKPQAATRMLPKPRGRPVWQIAVPVVVLAVGLGGWLMLRGDGVENAAEPAIPPAGEAAAGGAEDAAATAEQNAPSVDAGAARPSPGANAQTATSMPRRSETAAPVRASEPRRTPPPSTSTPAPTPRPTPRPVASTQAPAPKRASPTPVPARAALTPAPVGQGHLNVVVRPWGEVSLDGEVIGTTPFPELEVEVGTHLVRVKHPAYEPLERKVRIEANRSTKLVIDLPKEAVRR